MTKLKTKKLKTKKKSATAAKPQKEQPKQAPAKFARLAPEVREDLIVDEATRYFAEHGPDASTTELARRLGITQPLLYRYFPTKDALIEKVYIAMWRTLHNPDWELLIDDRNRNIEDRLTDFYIDYTRVVLTYSATRLTLFVRLHNLAPKRRYYVGLRDRIFPLMVRAVRRDLLKVDPSPPVSDDEMELVETLHGGIVHLAQRRWVEPHPHPREHDTNHLIRLKVRLFLPGARAMLPLLRSQAEAE